MYLDIRNRTITDKIYLIGSYVANFISSSDVFLRSWETYEERLDRILSSVEKVWFLANNHCPCTGLPQSMPNADQWRSMPIKILALIPMSISSVLRGIKIWSLGKYHLIGGPPLCMHASYFGFICIYRHWALIQGVLLVKHILIPSSSMHYGNNCYKGGSLYCYTVHVYCTTL